MKMRRRTRRRGIGHMLIRTGIVFIAAVFALSALDSRLRPVVEELAVVELDNHLTEEINRLSEELTASGVLDHAKLIQVTYGPEDTVVGAVTDMEALNHLRIELGDALARSLDGMERKQIQIPLGTALGVTLLSGLGPDITVEAAQTGQADITFRSSVEEMGINQTLHRIDMEISVQVLLLLPGGSNRRKLESVIPVAEWVLVGQTPDTYATLGGTGCAADSSAVENGK